MHRIIITVLITDYPYGIPKLPYGITKKNHISHLKYSMYTEKRRELSAW